VSINTTGILDSTPPSLRGASGSSPPHGWEVFFNLFFYNLRGRKRSLLNYILNSSCLGTVDPDVGRELDGCWDGCNTGICGSRPA